MSRRHDNLQEVEQSPGGRYIRFDEKLGNGAYKDVWVSYDSETGKEVAWNAVDLRRMAPQERGRIKLETSILSELHHPHIINFYHVWENPEKEQICFTTEIVTSGTLKQYTSRVKNVKLKVLKKWARQILDGLHYLHSHNPPIIHRDLKCDNIFINGGTGEIRIGDFGLSAQRHQTAVHSVLGTPEFMAPELYDEVYTEAVDIYAFGMCFLEMATKEYPYQECKNAAQIWKKVSAGAKPAILDRILDPQVRSFVSLCLSHHSQRPSAWELLQHPFLRITNSSCTAERDNYYVELGDPIHSPPHTPLPNNVPNLNTNIAMNNGPSLVSPANSDRSVLSNASSIHPFQTQSQSQSQSQPSQPQQSQDSKQGSPPYNNATNPKSITKVPPIQAGIESVDKNIANVVLYFNLEGAAGQPRFKKQVKFKYDFAADTSDAIAGEMVRALKLGEVHHALIQKAIDDAVRAHTHGEPAPIIANPTQTGKMSSGGDKGAAGVPAGGLASPTLKGAAGPSLAGLPDLSLARNASQQEAGGNINSNNITTTTTTTTVVAGAPTVNNHNPHHGNTTTTTNSDIDKMSITQLREAIIALGGAKEVEAIEERKDLVLLLETRRKLAASGNLHTNGNGNGNVNGTVVNGNPPVVVSSGGGGGGGVDPAQVRALLAKYGSTDTDLLKDLEKLLAAKASGDEGSLQAIAHVQKPLSDSESSQGSQKGKNRSLNEEERERRRKKQEEEAKLAEQRLAKEPLKFT